MAQSCNEEVALYIFDAENATDDLPISVEKAKQIQAQTCPGNCSNRRACEKGRKYAFHLIDAGPHFESNPTNKTYSSGGFKHDFFVVGPLILSLSNQFTNF